MNWATAAFGIVFAIVSFFAYVYKKEYAREEKLYQEFLKSKQDLAKAYGGQLIPVYIEPPPTKSTKPKKEKAIAADLFPSAKGKKNIN